MSLNILAVPTDKEIVKSSYIDSLRHNNTVYTENETRNLIKYLKALKDTSPLDSMRKYSAEAMLNYSWYLMNKGEWFLCGDLLKNALQYCQQNDQTLLHQIETAIAGINLYNENYNEAGRLLLKSNKYFLEHSDTVEWIKNCVNLGLYYSRIHNRPKALEYYMKVLDIAQKEKKYENYYSIVSGYAERVEEDSIIGLNILEKALRISIDNGYTFLLASNYNELASYYYRMENYHEALVNARKALNYAERFSQETMQTTAYGIMSDVNYIQKNYVSAYSMLVRKSSIIEKLHENIGKNYYSHLNEIDSLINWINTNIPPLSGSDDKGIVEKSKKTPDFTWWIFILLSCALTGGRRNSNRNENKA
ncbi:MAG: tetratricopeptide repeat protein [Bacteroides sp.]|nr:tetratricopeptide repeat protein [Bacteroides sp.]